jgi:hypothetical protein
MNYLIGQGFCTNCKTVGAFDTHVSTKQLFCWSCGADKDGEVTRRNCSECKGEGTSIFSWHYGQFMCIKCGRLEADTVGLTPSPIRSAICRSNGRREERMPVSPADQLAGS